MNVASLKNYNTGYRIGEYCAIMKKNEAVLHIPVYLLSKLLGEKEQDEKLYVVY